MANVLKHRFASAKSDGADASQVQPSHWNDGHLFTGGNAGDVLTRDPADANFGAKWSALSGMGQWQPVPYSAANFGAQSPMTWAITSPQIYISTYTVIGKTLFWQFLSIGSTIGGSPSPLLFLVPPVAVPYQHMPNRVARAQIGGVVVEMEITIYSPGYLQISKLDDTNIPLGTLRLDFSCFFPIA